METEPVWAWLYVYIIGGATGLAPVACLIFAFILEARSAGKIADRGTPESPEGN